MAFTSHPGGATHEISRLRHPDAALSRASGRVAGHLHAWPTPRSQARCRTRGPRLAPATRVNRRSPATLAMSSGLSRSHPPAALFRRLPAKDNLGYFAVTSRDFGAAACNAFSHCTNLQQYCSARRRREDDRHCCRNLRVCAPIMSCAPSRQFCTWQRAMPPSCGAMFGPQRDATSVPRARTAPRAVCARCGPYRGRRIERPCSAACQYSFDTAFSTCNLFLNVQPYSTRCHRCAAAAAREELPLGHRSDAAAAARKAPQAAQSRWRLQAAPAQRVSQLLRAAGCRALQSERAAWPSLPFPRSSRCASPRQAREHYRASQRAAAAGQSMSAAWPSLPIECSPCRASPRQVRVSTRASCRGAAGCGTTEAHGVAVDCSSRRASTRQAPRAGPATREPAG